MKVKTLALAAGVGALAFAGTASASLLGWSVDIETVSIGGTNYDVHRFYADYEAGANAHILGAGSINNSVSSFGTSDPNGFLSTQDPNFGYSGNAANFAPQAFQVQLIPGAAYTSYLTIGSRAGDGPGPVSLTPNAFGMADPDNQNVWSHAPSDGSIGDPHVIGNNELIFTTNPNSERITAQWSFDTHGEWRIKLLQLTVGEGEKLNVSNWRFESTDLDTGEITVGEINFQTALPAPGALALLGLAGLVGVRRRR